MFTSLREKFGEFTLEGETGMAETGKTNIVVMWTVGPTPWPTANESSKAMSSG
jgi:hypothetical protein